MIGGKDFALDLARKKPAVLLNEMHDSVELLFDEAAFIRDDDYRDDSQPLVVLRVDFGNGGIEAASQPLDKTFDNFAFVLDRAQAVQMDRDCQRTDYDKNLLIRTV